MSINTARLTQRFGKLVGWLNEINSYRGTTLTARVTTIDGQYTSVNPDLVGGLYSQEASAIASLNGQVTYIKQLAEAVLIAEVQNDRPLPSATKANALAEWNRQMRVAGDTFNASPAAGVVANIGSPTGDYTLIYTGKDGTGVEQDLILPDVYLFQCDQDKDSGGTQYAERFTIRGKARDANLTDYTYPSGTGVNTTITTVNPAATFGAVSDGAFTSWNGGSPNSLTSWTAGTGCTYGTQLLKATDDPRNTSGSASLDLKGDGTAIPAVKQAVTNNVVAGGVYAVHLRLKKVNDPGTDWAVTVRLVDGSGAVLSNCTLSSSACSALNANWTNVLSGFFHVPAVKPSAVYLEIRMHQSGSVNTAPVNLAECEVNHLSVFRVDSTPNLLYTGGPRVALFSGTTAAVVGDASTVTVTVAGTYSSYLLAGIDRLLDLKATGIRLPSDNVGGETILDSLVS